MSDAVELSVIVVASWSPGAAQRTVASILRSDGADDRVELIVVSDPSIVSPGRLSGRAFWLAGSPGDDVPRLRRLGADHARGRVLAFVEDACVVGPAWVAAMKSAFVDESRSAATGPVFQPASGSSTNWAVYFCEYASFVENFGGRLAGINFAVRRDSLDASRPIREAEVSGRLAGSIGIVEWAAVIHVRNYRFGAALADRWRFGREFGQDRWADRPGCLKRLGLLAAPAILMIQLLRLARCIVGRPRRLGPLLTAFMPTLALLTAWSVGEALGWSDACRVGSRRRERAARKPA